MGARWAFAAAVLAAAGLAAEPLAETAAASRSAGQARVRPRDPWIVRGDVGELESALEIALAPDLTVAYEPRTCSLARAWCAGGAKQAGADSLRFSGGIASWWLVRDGVATALDARWIGYSVAGGQVTLRYELRGAGARIEVSETPEVVRPPELAEDPAAIAPWVGRDMVGLRRSFRAHGAPQGAIVCLALSDRIAGGVVAENLGDAIEAEGEDGYRRLHARLPLDGDESWNEVIYFFAAPAKPSPR